MKTNWWGSWILWCFAFANMGCVIGQFLREEANIALGIGNAIGAVICAVQSIRTWRIYQEDKLEEQITNA
jgi:uncharacterized membrane protein YjjB (DUF3815 family)